MSDEDMFQQSQPDFRLPPSPPNVNVVSRSQPQPSDVLYHWVIMFHWDINNKFPFSMFVRSTFPDSEIPDSWYTFRLSEEYRLQKKYLRTLNGQYSVFCKVEKGNNYIKNSMTCQLGLSCLIHHFYSIIKMPLNVFLCHVLYIFFF